MYAKLISFFVLLAVFGSMYYFYYYFFVLNKGNLTIISNTGEYSISLYTPQLKTSFTSECKNSKCELIDIAPFDYEITIKKEGYKELKRDIKINKKETLTLEIQLEKQLKITPLEAKTTNPNEDKLEKFREISSLQKSYHFTNLEDMGYFYFLENPDTTLTLYHKKDTTETKIYSLKKIEKQKIQIQKVYQTPDTIAIIYGENTYIYHMDSGNMIEIFFPQPVSYIKQNNTSYQFVNEKGSFLYDIKSKKMEYFYTFKDFITYDEQNYFGIIYDSESDKKKNYNLENMDGNLIVKYNFKTKQIKVLETIGENITKIVHENGNIYFYNESGNTFLVNNIE